MRGRSIDFFFLVSEMSQDVEPAILEFLFITSISKPKSITGQSPDFSARRRRPNLHSNHRRSVSNNRQALLS